MRAPACSYSRKIRNSRRDIVNVARKEGGEGSCYQEVITITTLFKASRYVAKQHRKLYRTRYFILGLPANDRRSCIPSATFTNFQYYSVYSTNFEDLLLTQTFPNAVHNFCCYSPQCIMSYTPMNVVVSAQLVIKAFSTTYCTSSTS